MKSTRQLILICFCFHFLNLSAQKTPKIQELQQKYIDYFALDREAVFLHLNKTKVVPTENIWFSAYVYNPKILRPNLATTNLNVNLYNQIGKLIRAKTVFIENGQGDGYFKLDSLTPPGKYLIKASTKYMENFREKLSFSQTFTILGGTNKLQTPIKYDLQLLPEGGHLVANVSNTIGVKLIDNNGKGVFFTDGKVLNSDQDLITTFDSNRFGLSKFRIIPKLGEEFTVTLTTEHGKEIRKKIVEPEIEGITLSVNALLPQEIILSIKTNQKTYEKIKGKPFIIAIHKEGQMRTLGFDISGESLEAIIQISKNTLYTGMNTITLFDQNLNPLSERLVFNRENLERKNITTEYKRMKGDSLIIELKSEDILELHSMSISVLPSATTAYQAHNGIFSAFYIEPYIKGNLGDGDYYFSDKITERRRNYDLDLLLLTQGWSKYSWQNIFNNTPEKYFEPEVGFTIKGEIQGTKEKSGQKVFLTSEKNDFFFVVAPLKENAFIIKNVFIRDKDKINISVISGRKNKLSKPPSIYMRILPLKDSKNLDSKSIEKTTLLIVPKEKNKKVLLENEPKIPENFIKDAVALSTVFLKAEKKSKIEQALEKDPLHGQDWYDKTIIDQSVINANQYILDLISKKGFTVTRHAGKNGKVLIESKRGIISFTAGIGTAKPIIYIDGFKLIDFGRLEYMKTNEVKAIYINKSAAGSRAQQSGGIIRIKMNHDYYLTQENENMNSFIASTGFANKKVFYTPKYNSYTTPAFSKYGTIAWFPYISLNESGKTKIKVFNTLQEKITLYIQGMTQSGGLISETLIVETK